MEARVTEFIARDDFETSRSGVDFGSKRSKVKGHGTVKCVGRIACVDLMMLAAVHCRMWFRWVRVSVITAD